MNNICIGTAQFGMTYGIANKSGKTTISTVKEIVYTATKNNISLYDTAQSYGNSEEILGKVFSELNINEKVKCITKLHPNFSYNNYIDLKLTIKKSLDKLKINNLYGLLIHRTKIDGDWDKFLSGIIRLKEERFIKNFGVTIYDPADAIKFANDKNIDIIQIPFNVLDRRLIDNNFFEIAQKNNKQIFIRSIYLQGLLLINDKDLKIKNMKWVLSYIKLLRSFAKEKKIDIKTFAIQGINDFTPSANIIIGVETTEQLIDNISIFKKKSISKKIINEWWNNLPLLPEKLLNPSLWRTNE